ncbi:C-type isolectin Sp-CL4-like [Brachionichthys hirsutus]|uniref:C-type isolectin Sp-CL4-like n=1 Tax=Brachionichthys hirsutus TaxID=412623 RepID=UPI0036053A52
MRPAVGAAALLLVCCLATVRADSCKRPPKECGDGWRRIDMNRCAKFFKELHTFSEAENRCHALESDLVSVHNIYELVNVLCLTIISKKPRRPIWIGAKLSSDQRQIQWTDGSLFDYAFWDKGEPNNVDNMEECIEMSVKSKSKEKAGRGYGRWKNAKCSKENYFVCAKEM